jgi:hypothetical protein
MARVLRNEENLMNRPVVNRVLLGDVEAAVKDAGKVVSGRRNETVRTMNEEVGEVEIDRKEMIADARGGEEIVRARIVLRPVESAPVFN